MNVEVKGIPLVCTDCSSRPFVEQDVVSEYSSCPSCHRKYRRWEGRPNFLSQQTGAMSPIWQQSLVARHSTGPITNFFRTASRILTAPRVRFRRVPHRALLEEVASWDGGFKALYLGYSQAFETRLLSSVIQMDVVPREYVDIVGAGESIPFPDESTDLVVISGVIEHTQLPFEVVREAYRILKPGGRLYISSPWVYPFHGGDNYRFSHEGLQLLCRHFDSVDVGTLNGPFHALAITILSIFTTYGSMGNRFLYRGLSVVGSWLVFPLVLLDAATLIFTEAKFVADANIYAIATKVDNG
jgi:SAM-dependent methyltransferase